MTGIQYPKPSSSSGWRYRIKVGTGYGTGWIRYRSGTGWRCRYREIPVPVTGATGCPEGIWGNRYISHRPSKYAKKKEKEIEALASPSRSRIRPHLRGSRRSGLRHLLHLRLSLPPSTLSHEFGCSRFSSQLPVTTGGYGREYPHRTSEIAGHCATRSPPLSPVGGEEGRRRWRPFGRAPEIPFCVQKESSRGEYSYFFRTREKYLRQPHIRSNPQSNNLAPEHSKLKVWPAEGARRRRRRSSTPTSYS